MEKHSVLTPALLTEIISSKVSDTTGQLAAPVMARLRTSSTDLPRARASSRPGIGSPVIFSSSPSDSPLKAFLDSPHTRQVTGYQKLLEERTVQNRELR